VCGRLILTSDPGDVRKILPDVVVPDVWVHRYNVAPSQQIAVVANREPKQIEFFRWGLIPSWARDSSIGDQMINARAESLAAKPAFRGPLRHRRCLVLADGFYEWQPRPDGRTRTPFCIRLKSGGPFAFAGLWDIWHSPEGVAIPSCTIITTAANEMMAPIHNRMPVILHPSAYGEWLDVQELSAERVGRLLGPYPMEEMAAYPVSSLVNNPRHDVPECLVPVG
jgi:putative SOS response-associated peptidase YedK